MEGLSDGVVVQFKASKLNSALNPRYGVMRILLVAEFVDCHGIDQDLEGLQLLRLDPDERAVGLHRLDDEAEVVVDLRRRRPPPDDHHGELPGHRRGDRENHRPRPGQGGQ